MKVFRFNSDSCHFRENFLVDRSRKARSVRRSPTAILQPNASSCDSSRSVLIYSCPSRHRSARNVLIYTSDWYVLPSTEGNINVANQWHNSALASWQTQLNFATWCATTGCGVSVHDHLQGHRVIMILQRTAETFLSRSFGSIATTRQVLHYQLMSHGTATTTYNHTVFQTVCNEFDVNPKSDWRLNRGIEWLARGPGSIFTRFGPELQ